MKLKTRLGKSTLKEPLTFRSVLGDANQFLEKCRKVLFRLMTKMKKNGKVISHALGGKCDATLSDPKVPPSGPEMFQSDPQVIPKRFQATLKSPKVTTR